MAGFTRGCNKCLILNKLLLPGLSLRADSFPDNETLGAEESYWLGVQSARTALAAAPAEMISENEVSEAQALQLAHGFLHDNAVGIYEGKVH